MSTNDPLHHVTEADEYFRGRRGAGLVEPGAMDDDLRVAGSDVFDSPAR